METFSLGSRIQWPMTSNLAHSTLLPFPDEICVSGFLARDIGRNGTRRCMEFALVTFLSSLPVLFDANGNQRGVSFYIVSITLRLCDEFNIPLVLSVYPGIYLSI